MFKNTPALRLAQRNCTSKASRGLVTARSSGASTALMANGCAASNALVAASFAVGRANVTKAVEDGRNPRVRRDASVASTAPRHAPQMKKSRTAAKGVVFAACLIVVIAVAKCAATRRRACAGAFDFRRSTIVCGVGNVHDCLRHSILLQGTVGRI